MIIAMLIFSCIVFGYAIGYAHIYFKHEAETTRILTEVKFWKDICTRQKEEIARRQAAGITEPRKIVTGQTLNF